MSITVVLAQVSVCWNIDENLETLSSVLNESRVGEVIALPEGMISGYDDELSGLDTLEPDVVENAIREVSRLVQSRRVHLFCGTLQHADGAWSNSLLYFSPDGASPTYRKFNLATHERGRLTAGSELPIFEVDIDGDAVSVSPQLCRDVRFPDQWHCPARDGAMAFVFLSCAANPRESLQVWRSHLVSRAAETQRYVIAVNVAHPLRNSPTIIVAPSGEVIAEVLGTESATIRADLDMSLVSDWYISQQRSDVIKIEERPENGR
ncbi:MAG: carbon-nitrogen hydrolase family protein [Acidimicrobiales bacterium]